VGQRPGHRGRRFPVGSGLGVGCGARRRGRRAVGCIGRLCEGEIAELQGTYRIDRTEAAYFASIDGKTASLFATAARIGGIVADLNRAQIDLLTEYGTKLGLVFQMVDDILDLTASEAELGKPAGHDLVEGVYSLPVLRALATGDSGAAELADLLGKPLEPPELDKALGIVRSSAGLGSAINTARTLAVDAERLAGRLPDSSASAALAQAAHHLVDSVATI
jgi:heptaprenyl diphosphate synthase